MGEREYERLRSRMLRDLERESDRPRERERALSSRVSSMGVDERPRETLRRSDMLVLISVS